VEALFGIPMNQLAIVLAAGCGLIVASLVVLGLRNRVMVRLGLRNIPRRRTQTVLIIVGLMLSTLIISAAFGTGDTMTHSFRSVALDSLGQADELIHTGGPMTLVGPNMEINLGPSTPDGAGRSVRYFAQSYFVTLAEQVARRQAEGDAVALLIEGLTPAIVERQALVINHTGRQSELQVTLAGYDPAQVVPWGQLRTVDGQIVTLAELGPDEVYLEKGLADRLDAAPGHELEIVVGKAALRATARAVVQAGALPGDVLLPLAALQAAIGQRDKINAIVVSNVGGPDDGMRHSSAVAGILKELLKSTGLQVHNDKGKLLLAANMIGSLFTTLFVAFGSFSIAAALLLIFLIFVMLAAERTREMGMARAVGTRRGHLVQMFLFEGVAYDVVAAAVGALLGAGVGVATIAFLAPRANGLLTVERSVLQLHHHLEPRSVLVAYCLGLLLTFVTVAISAWRVSRLNIVAAIRDLPPPPHQDSGVRHLFVQQGRYLADTVRQLGRLRPLHALKRLLWDGPLSTLALLWALVVRGPLVILLGLVVLRTSQSERSAFLYGMGVSLFIIGTGLLLRWVLGARHVRPSLRDRIAFSLIGIGLLVFWMLPLDTLRFLHPPVRKGNTGPEMFVLAGVMMIAGAVWTIIYNSEVLLGLLTLLLRPFHKLLPVVRTAIAYPMQFKVRTGLTIAMFALVILMLAFMSVLVGVVDQVLDPESASMTANMPDLFVFSHPFKPIPSLWAAIRAAPEINPADFLRVESSGGGLYQIYLAEGVDAPAVARALESTFVDYGLTTSVPQGDLEAGSSLARSSLALLEAFMSLGLIVGSASIGIISARAVVERRQQIGMLRAIGYRRWMIQWSFLLEASFVALLGIGLGVGLGLVLAHNFFAAELAQSGFMTEYAFNIPWATLGIVAAIAYGTSLLTTLLPSWQASRIYPAEALRYE